MKDENEAIKVLRHAEAVLQKRINQMKNGQPQWSAVNRLKEIRDAIKIIEDYNIESPESPTIIIEGSTRLIK